MPITYEHRVPASTLGGLALAAGQEQYEAQRGREDRERAMKLAQMAQQQQMQNQRMAYDAASTQYRTAADYNKFVMGAQLQAQQRQQDHQDRLALQNNNDQLGAGREEARWDRAQEQAGQQDTFGAWKEYVTATLPGLNQDGKDILNNHAGKVRTIMSNQKFNRTQKAAAVSQVLEEVQGLGLDQNYAVEQMYEPGKSYNNATGETFLWDGKKSHIQGRHYDGLIKPDDMSDADWMGGGRNKAWMDKYTIDETRDEDGKRVRHFISNGEMTSRVDEDDQYKAEQQEIKDNEMREEDEKLRATWVKDKSAFAKDYLDAMNAASPIGQMMGPNEESLGNEEKLAELERRRQKARDAADEQFPEPSRRVPAAAAAAGGGGRTQWPDDALGLAEPGVDYSRAVSYVEPNGDVKGIQPEGASRDMMLRMDAMPRSQMYGKDPSRLLDADGNPLAPALDARGGQFSPAAAMGEQPSPAASGIPLGGRRMTAGAGPAPADKRQRMRDTMLKYRDEIDDPQMKGVVDEGIAALDAVMGGAPETPELKQKLRDAKKTLEVQTMQTERATEQGSSVEDADMGRFRQQKLRRQQALNAGVLEGGTGQMPTPSEGGDEAMHLARPHNPKAWLGGASGGLPASEPMPGQRDPKVPFERTPEQVRAEENIRALGPRPDRIPGSIHQRPIGGERTGVERPKGEGHVGAMSGEGGPWQVSRETEAKRKARGEEPYTLEELDKMTRRSYPKGRELSKEEKIKDRIEDPKTAEKTLFTEIWPGQGRTDPEWLVKSEGKEGGLWGKDKNAEEIGKIYDHLGEWDLHHPGETKEKFISKFTKSGANIPGKHDPSGYAPKQEAGAKGEKELVSLRSEYVARLKTKLMIKEARSGQESAKARQERFERQYREQRKYEDGQGTLTGGRDVSDRAGPPGVRAKPKVGTEADIARYGLPGKPSPEQVPGNARKFVDDEFVGRRTRTDRRDMTKELGNLKNYVTAMGLENTDTGGEILKLSPGDISVMPTKDYDVWMEEVQDMFKEK